MDKNELELKQNIIKGINDLTLKQAILDSSLDELYKISDNIEKESKKKETTFQPQDFINDVLDVCVKKWEQNTDEILGLRLNKFPQIEEALDGIQPGLIVIGADANVGKTGLLISLTANLIDSNNDAFVIVVSGDDSAQTMSARLVAHVGQTSKINNIKKLGFNKLKNVQEGKNIQLAINTSRNKLRDRIVVYDQTRIKSISDIEKAILAHTKEGRKIVVCIDALLNIDIDNETLDVRIENERRATQSKQLTIEYEIPVITTAELKKPTSKGKEEAKPTIHDIAETRKYSFEADAIFLLRKNTQTGRKPSSEIVDIYCDLAKNKLSNGKPELELEYHVTKSLIREKGTKNTQNDTKKTSYENLSDEELINME